MTRPAEISLVSGFALGRLVLLGGAVALALFVGAAGYGYHRDELYFLVAGDHLAWGYADQGPLTPFMAHVMDGVAPGSLRMLRLPSALMSGATVIATGALAFELGASRRAQLIAGGCIAVGAFPLSVGHLLSTSTFDLLAWSALSWLVARAVRTGETAIWPLAGLVAGLALLDKPLIAFLLVALAAGFLAAGPRAFLRERRLWIGAGIALVLWSPWLVWQAGHDWPQLTVSSAIASGGSGSSQPRWALLPFQFLLISPVLSPIWVAGLVGLLRESSMRRYRFFAVAWLCLAAIFLIAGGKPYYVAGLFPALLAAGALAADAWLERGSTDMRRAALAAAFLVSAGVSLVLALPVLPARDAGIVLAANGDIGETIGWPDFARSVARVYERADGPHAVIFTSNYGEAGAIDRYGPTLGLPRAYSGHNGFAAWGPPPDRPGPVVAVGLDADTLARSFTGCRLAGRVENSAGVGNDEQGVPIDLCSATRRPWSRIWPDLRHLG
jgi:hypothetical protein